MTLQVYITKQCQEDARDHSLYEQIERLRERVFLEQRTGVFDQFPPPFIKKRFGNLRLIAEHRILDEHNVICFLRILPRSSDEYGAFLDSNQDQFRETLRSLVSDDDLRCWLQEQFVTHNIVMRPAPSQSEETFLWNALTAIEKTGTDLMVCESEDWVKLSEESKFVNRFSHFWEALEKIADEKNLTETEYRLPSGDSILYRYFSNHRMLFLIAPFMLDTRSQIRDLRLRYNTVLTAPAEELTKEDILKYTVRAYPALVLADLDIWSQIQKNAEANIALSPEETRVLQSVVATPTGQKNDEMTGFPLFINGRAGSGKSTVLQYLFSEYLYYYLTHHEKFDFAPPIYFTYNRELLQRSRRVVEDLIKSNHQKLIEGSQNQELFKEYSQDVDQSFQEFHSFLYNCLPASKRQGRFARTNYINYPRFKILWEKKFSHQSGSRQKYGPDLSWHVIRTYVKGYSIEPGSYLDLEEYRQLPQKQHTVTTETFRIIHDKVWNNWYQKLAAEKDYWDDQDLAHELLELDLIQPKYPAVFCDESQDFTQLELEILFRLCLFSDRDLQAHLINRIPFTFAGDPFQTLNPTGFRWDAIKAAFVEKFIYSMAPYQRTKLVDLNYQELKLNYRSSKNIVKLCNTIQAMRASLFNIQMLRPQETYQFEQNAPMPVSFKWDDSSALENLKKETDITIIVPCEEGEEEKFVEENETLSSIVKRDETGVPQMVLSASRAKGLEFNRVVLFGFGEHAPKALLEHLTSEEPLELSPDEALPLEYFVNRLYVAASRPKKRLFILDSQEGLKRLWAFAERVDLQEGILKRLRHGKDIWGEHLGMVQQGVAESWSEDRENLHAIGLRFEAEGNAKQDPYLLRSAAMSFESIGEIKLAQKCRAEARVLEGTLMEAAEIFLQNEYSERAAQVFWLANNYDGVLRTAERHPSVMDMPEHRMSAFLKYAPSVEEGTSLLRDLLHRTSNPEFLSNLLFERSWERAIKELMNKLVSLNTPDTPEEVWKRIAALLEQIRGKGIKFDKTSLARVHFLAQNMEHAVAMWDEVGDQPKPDYLIAKVASLPYPDNLELLEELERPEEIIAAYEAHVEESLPYKARNIVADAYSIIGNYDRALTIYADLKAVPSLLIMISNTREDNLDVAKRGAYALVDALVHRAEWRTALYLGERGEIQYLKDTLNLSFREINRFLRTRHSELQMMLVRSFARSEKLADEVSDNKKAIMNLVKKLVFDLDGLWKEHVPLEEAGAAVERAGKDIEALEFYEKVESSGEFSREEQLFAAGRWIKCKERQAERDMQNSRTMNAAKRRKEAERKRLELGISREERLPEFPILPSLTPLWTQSVSQLDSLKEEMMVEVEFPDPSVLEGPPLVEPPTPSPEVAMMEKHTPTATGATLVGGASIQQAAGATMSTDWVIDGLRFTYYHHNGRLNIVSETSGDTVSVRALQGEVRGDAKLVEQPTRPGTFISDEWGIECDVSAVPTTRRFSVTLLEKGISCSSLFRIPINSCHGSISAPLSAERPIKPFCLLEHP